MPRVLPPAPSIRPGIFPGFSFNTLFMLALLAVLANMIISHKYKFIFIKTAKTAGTSIEIALSRFCGPGDVITPISPEDEEIRMKLGFRGPQNYLSPLRDYGLRDALQLIVKGNRKLRFWNHISCREIKERVGSKIWSSYYKFCFERNPWDRVISLYYYDYESEPRPTISEFIRSKSPLILKKRGYSLYTIDGRVAVDRVCKFENISEELEVIQHRVGIPEKLQLPNAKSRFRQDRRKHYEVLKDQDRLKIAEMFYDEISLLGYEF